MLCQLHDNLVVRIPAQAGFYGNRYLYGIYHGTGNLQHLGNILQHTCTGSLARYALHGAAEVNIENIRTRLLYDAGGFHHGFGIFAVYLYGYRSFLITDIQLLFGLADGAYQGIGRYEFRVHHVGTELLAHQPECRVGDVFHRS